VRTAISVISLLLATVLAPVGLATPTSAAVLADAEPAVVSSDGTDITIQGTAGVNDVRIYYETDSQCLDYPPPNGSCFSVVGATAGENCAPLGDRVWCATGAYPDRPVVTARLGDGDDRFEMPADLYGGIRDVTVLVSGGGGNDTFLGSYGQETWRGGSGDDRLIPDRLVKISDDFPEQEFGPDDFYGGPGLDTIDYHRQAPTDDNGKFIGVTVTLDGVANDGMFDNVRPSVEHVIGTSVGDELGGRSGAETLEGREGPDKISGGRGADLLVGGAGDDTVYAVDGTRDVVRCGTGALDRLRADLIDSATGCEVLPLRESRVARLNGSDRPLVSPRSKDYPGAVRYGEIFYFRAERQFFEDIWRYGFTNVGTMTVSRRLVGASGWRTVARDPGARLVAEGTALRNARYRFQYTGGRGSVREFAAATRTAWLKVQRNVTTRADGSLLKGRVRPSYADRMLNLQRKKCGMCDWVTVGKVRTNQDSRFRVDIGGPNGSRYRLTIPRSRRWATSYSDVWRLRDRRIVLVD